MVDRLSDQIYAGKKEREKMEIVPNEKIEHADASKILAYGPSGSGKTKMIETLVPLGKVLVLDAEGGLLSIRGVKGIDVARILSVADLREAYSFLSKGGHDYKWVALDSISEISEMILVEAKGKIAERVAGGEKVDARQAYFMVLEDTVRICKAFRDLPMSLYFSCKQSVEKDESGSLAYTLGFPGNKLHTAIPYLFDTIFRMHVEKSENGEPRHLVQTRKDGASEAKSRGGKLNMFEPADLAAIVAKMKS